MNKLKAMSEYLCGERRHARRSRISFSFFLRRFSCSRRFSSAKAASSSFLAMRALIDAKLASLTFASAGLQKDTVQKQG